MHMLHNDRLAYCRGELCRNQEFGRASCSWVRFPFLVLGLFERSQIQGWTFAARSRGGMISIGAFIDWWPPCSEAVGNIGTMFAARSRGGM